MVQSKSLGVFTIILLAKKRRDCTVLLELPGNAHQIQLPVPTSITRRQDAINELTGRYTGPKLHFIGVVEYSFPLLLTPTQHPISG
jgi:hypothetical protein